LAFGLLAQSAAPFLFSLWPAQHRHFSGRPAPSPYSLAHSATRRPSLIFSGGPSQRSPSPFLPLRAVLTGRPSKPMSRARCLSLLSSLTKRSHVSATPSSTSRRLQPGLRRVESASARFVSRLA
jgi:hypothetical protein